MSLKKENRHPSCVELQQEVDTFLEPLSGNKSLRQVSSFMETLFAEKRAARQKLIDEQIARANLATTSSRDISTLTTTNTSSLPVFPTITATGDSGDSVPSAVRTGTAENGERPGSKRSSLALIGLLLAALLVGGLIAVRRAGDGSSGGTASSGLARQAPPSVSTIMAPPVDSTPAAATKAVLSLSARPATAKLFLDGSPLEGNPLSRALPKDGATHTFRAEAKGYTSKEVSVLFDADKEVELTLDKEAPAHPGFTWTPPPKVSHGPTGPSGGTPATANPEPKPPAGPPGFLSLDTYPWTRVSEGGRVLGQTPLVRVPLPEGDHTLVLENPDQNVRQTLVVKIKGNETTTRRLGLGK